MIRLLQCTHGFGVRPRTYSATKSSITSPNASARFSTYSGTSSVSAARRASEASCGVQHPRDASADAAAVPRHMNTPVTSYPSSLSSAAATAESTPPLIATITLSFLRPIAAILPPAGSKPNARAATGADASAHRPTPVNRIAATADK